MGRGELLLDRIYNSPKQKERVEVSSENEHEGGGQGRRKNVAGIIGGKDNHEINGEIRINRPFSLSHCTNTNSPIGLFQVCFSLFFDEKLTLAQIQSLTHVRIETH